MKNIKRKIDIEEYRLRTEISDDEKSNILYNLIFLKKKANLDEYIYKDIKLFIYHYLRHLKSANYGYDNINYDKILTLINLLPLDQKVSIIDYIILNSTKELPEVNQNWFLTKKHNFKIEEIFKLKKKNKYIYGIFLICGKSTTNLLLSLILIFILINIILLPAYNASFELFKITYEIYSDNFTINHILNVLTLFVDLDNKLTITPNNYFGLLLIVFGKILFAILLINFIYIKISDKILTS
ncbi:hypothetical protein [Flavobacterium sp. 7A]|uniref:hypothetical protein n=1 Tax=Flavobacterium sp. 7A TaxID=2940571 RepID=UPI002226D1E9|nr:hypothetical protein [Flavobacterium sp. 7A]MCW2119206.1 hypothetical protein [Flavobacterium sp. 7A]